MAGTNPRSRQRNPRAEADQAEAARLEAEAAARQADLDAATAARHRAEREADREADRLEAEALAVSASLDDAVLAELVDVVTRGMAGPLARSPLAISRAVVAWCRTAVQRHPGPLVGAVTVGLGGGLSTADGTAATLALPAAPPGTPSLRQRIAEVVNRAGGE